MGGVNAKNRIPSFSSCGIEKLQILNENGKHYCLKNKPEVVHSVLPSCGNGILESGEECDCGLWQNCYNHCCDAITCTYANNAECATGSCCDLNVSELVCKTIKSFGSCYKFLSNQINFVLYGNRKWN